MNRHNNLMKQTFIIWCLIFFFATLFSEETQKGSSQQIQQTVTLSNEALSFAQNIASILFNPVYHGVSGQTESTTQDGTPNPYPTTSLNEQAVDATFGPKGMNLDTTTIRYIKNFYFYLEYATRVERAAFLAALALQSNIMNAQAEPTDFFTLITQEGWSGVVTALQKLYGSWDSLQNTLQKKVTEPAWSSIKESIKATSWQEIVTTDFWKAIPISNNDIIQSTVWQEYLKYTITQTFLHDTSLLGSIAQAESTIFKFIPDIEVAYYHPDYTHLRYSSELFRINLILTDTIRSRLLPHCSDWKQYLDPQAKNSDINDAYQAAKNYTQTPFFTYLSQQTLSNSITIPKVVAEEPLIQERLTIIAMTQNLRALTQTLYDLDVLAATNAVLANTSIEKPTPSFLLHTADDYYFLEDRAITVQALLKAAQATMGQSTNTSLTNNAVTTQSLMPAFSAQTNPDTKQLHTVVVQSFFGDLWSSVKNAAGSVWHAAKSLGEGVASLSLKVGGVLAAPFSTTTAHNLENASQALAQKAKADFEDTYKDAQATIADATKAAEDVTDGFGKGLGLIFGKIDPQLGKDMEGAFDALADTALEALAGVAHVAVAEAAGVVRLSSDAVTVASDVILGGLAGITGNSEGASLAFSNLGVDIKALGQTIVTSILDVVTVAVAQFTTVLKSVIKFVAYMVSVITDEFIDISKGVALLAAGIADIFGADVNPSQWESKTSEYLENHRRTINSVIITGLMIGVAVATDGASVPALAMIGGQQVFQIAGSYQQDEMQEEKLKEEKQFIDDYRVFVDHNQVIATQQQTTWSDELTQKYQAEITNQERTLGFYQNHLEQTFNYYQQQMAEQLGNYLAPQLTPDPKYGITPADLGGIYGFSTGVYEFNPSQGFAIYTKTRNSFSQEIAVFPALEKPTDNASQTIIKNIPSKFWFIQQETYPLTAPITTVEIRFRAIYTLTTYHIGLYFGGRPYDIEAIKKNNSAPLDAAHLAKMLVFKKTDATQPSVLGFYQHEATSLDQTKNWLYEDTNAAQFQVGQWYHMKMSMANPTTAQYKVWQENEQEPEWTHVTVQAQTDPLTTIGVISSGASIEYQFITPSSVIQDLPAVKRTPLPTEKSREAAAQATTQALSTGSIGNYKLQIVDKITLLKRQYIFTTIDTGLKDKNGKAVEDYVLICQIGSAGTVQKNSLGLSLQNLGDNPGIVSVITGTIYDKTGEQHGTLPNVLTIWLQKHGPLHTTLQQIIVAAQKNYINSLMQPIKFGALTLLPTSTQEISNGQFIYTTTTPELEQDGKPVKNAAGKQHSDYFTFVTENSSNSNIETFNMPYSNKNKALLSLVSGLVYDNSSPNKVVDGTSMPYAFDASWFEAVTQLRPELLQAIQAAITAYNAQATKAISGTNNTNAANSNDISNNQGVNQGSTGVDTKITPTATAQKNINQQQQQANSGQECFGC